MSRKLLLVFIFAIFIRTLFFYVAYKQSGEEYRAVTPYLDGYYQISENLLAGNGFSRDIAAPFLPDSVRTPLYPLLLAGLVYFFKSYYAVLVVHILLGSLIPLFGFRLARQLTKNEKIATIVAILLAFEPFAILLSVTILSETFFTVLFLAGMTLFFDYVENVRGSVLAFATAFFALATLARPTIQFLPLLLIFAILYLAKGRGRFAIKHSFIVVGVFLVVIAPWSIRNFMLFGNPALSVQYASVPYGYLIPSVIALEKNIGFEEAKRGFYAGEGNIDSVEDITLSNATEYKRRILPILRMHPVGFIKSASVTLLTFFTHDGYMDVLYRLGSTPNLRLERPALTLLSSPKEALLFAASLIKSPVLFVILGRIVWVLISLLFIIGAWRFLKTTEHRLKGIFVLLIIAYFVLTTVAVGLAVNARFRFPVNAIIVMFAVYGGCGLWASVTTFLQKRQKTEMV